MIRAQPMDAVVLMGGCDKTVPAQIMGAVSAGRPAVMLVAGPMMPGRHKGERLGACTDCRRVWAPLLAGGGGQERISPPPGRPSRTPRNLPRLGDPAPQAGPTDRPGPRPAPPAAHPAAA